MTEPSKSIDTKFDGASKVSADEPADDITEWTQHWPARQLGDYQLGEELGRGGMGVVYRATEVGLGRDVALKLLPDKARLSATQVERFLLEARAAARLNHNHIIPIFHVGEDAGTWFYTMKLIEGRNIAQVIREAKTGSETQQPTASLTSRQAGESKSTVKLNPKATKVDTGSPGELSGNLLSDASQRSNPKAANQLAYSIAMLGHSVADALQHAHEQGVVHRDIKPSNLILDADHKVWVADFGLAQLQNSPRLTQTGDVVGTLRYMSPEQASGRRGFVDHRTDIYSLGITLYELATLRRAYQSKTTRELLREITFERPTPIHKLNNRLPRDFSTIIGKATERNPADRYQTAADFAEDLKRFAEGKSLSAKPPSALKRAKTWLTERPLVSASLLASGIVCLLALALTSWALAGQLAERNRSLAVVSDALQTKLGQWLLAESRGVTEQDPALGIALAARGAKLAPGPSANAALLHSLNQNHELLSVQTDNSDSQRLHFNRSGDQLVIGTGANYNGQADKTKIIDLTSGQIIATLENSEQVTTSIYSPDGKTLLTGGITKSISAEQQTLEKKDCVPIVAWNTETYEQGSIIRDCHACELSDGVFSPSRPQIALPNWRNEIVLLNTQDWQTVEMTLRGHSAPIVQAIFSPDGSRIASWSTDGKIIMWNANTGQQTDQANIASSRPLWMKLAFSPDSKYLMLHGNLQAHISSSNNLADKRSFSCENAAFSQTPNVIRWKQYINDISLVSFDLQENKLINEYFPENYIYDYLELSENGLLATISEKGNINLVDIDAGTVISQLRGHKDHVMALAKSPNKKRRLASLSWDGTLKLWDWNSDLSRRTEDFTLPTDIPTIVNISAAGNQAIVGNFVQTITQIYAFEPSPNQQQPRVTLAGKIRAKLPNGNLVTTTADQLIIWDATSSRQLRSVRLPTRYIDGFAERTNAAVDTPEDDTSIDDTPSGAVFLTETGRLYQWDYALNQCQPLTGPDETVNRIAVNRQQDLWYLGFTNGNIEKLDLSTLQREVVVKLNASIFQIDLSQDQQRLLISKQDRTAIIWDLKAGKQTHSLGDSNSPVYLAWFTRSDANILTIPDIRTQQITLRELDSESLGAVKATFELPIKERFVFRGVAWNPTRTQLAFILDQHGGHVWNLELMEQFEVTKRTSQHVSFTTDRFLFCASGSPQVSAEESAEQLIKSAEPSLIHWDAARHTVLKEEPLELDVSRLATLDSNGEFVVSGGSHNLRIVDLDTGNTVGTLNSLSSPCVLAKFCCNQQIVTVTQTGSINLHSRTGTRPVKVAEHEYQVTHAVLSPDGRLLLSTDEAGITIQSDLASRSSAVLQQTPQVNIKHAFGPSGNRVVSFGGSHPVRVWDARSKQGTEIEIDEGVHSAVFSPDEALLLLLVGQSKPRIASAGFNRGRAEASQSVTTAWLINLENGQRSPIKLANQTAMGHFVGNNQQLVLLDSRGTLTLHQINDLQRVSTLAADIRFQALLQSQTGSDKIYAVHRDGVSVFTPSETQVAWEIPTNVQTVNVQRRVNNWQVSNDNAQWLLLPHQNTIMRVPRDPLKYAEAISPRSLTQPEEVHYSISTWDGVKP
ncbi:protein kinase domain-containing protein [Planctomycetaceae bacterium SH139]